MAQKLERYYGFRLTVAKEIGSKEYSSLRREIAAIAKKIEQETGRKFTTYISMCQFVIKRDLLFGIGPLAKRLDQLTLTWRVRPEEQRKGTLFFLNDFIPTEKVLIDSPTEYEPSKHKIACVLKGAYVQSQEQFRILIVAAIDRRVKTKRRNVTLSALAAPTAIYADQFRNTNGKISTKVTYSLARNVQLLLNIDIAKPLQ